MTSDRHIPDDRLDSYLAAARACMLDVGWRRTTLTEVARRAGVSRMTIYRAWPDMSSLLGDLMTREWETLLGATLTAEQPDQAQPATQLPARIAAEFVAAVSALRNNDLFLRIVELDPELLLPYLLARRGRSQEAVATVLAAQIAQGQSSGAIRTGNPVTMARALLLTAHGHTLSAQTMVDDDTSLTALDEEFALLVERSLTP